MLSAMFFFATPYHSWGHELNEHINNLIRQYFLKSMDTRMFDRAEVFHRALDALENPDGAGAGT